MRKNLLVALMIVMIATGCGEKDDKKETTTEATTANVTVEETTATTEATTEKTTAEVTTEATTEAEKEMTLDAIAKYLVDGGYVTGEQTETMYSYIGAIGGFKYLSSDVEVYEYDTSSDTYQEIVDSKNVSGLKVSAINGPFVLLFSNGNENQDVIDAFNAY